MSRSPSPSRSNSWVPRWFSLPVSIVTSLKLPDPSFIKTWVLCSDPLCSLITMSISPSRSISPTSRLFMEYWVTILWTFHSSSKGFSGDLNQYRLASGSFPGQRSSLTATSGLPSPLKSAVLTLSIACSVRPISLRFQGTVPSVGLM